VRWVFAWRARVEKDDKFQMWCDSMAALLALPIEAGDRAVILTNLKFIASQIDSYPLGDEIEPAPVFQA
jgi:hypothetical protein